jgi:uridylate kinase
MSTNFYTPFLCGTWTKLFSKDDAVADLQAGKVVFFAGGTGHPYFSTDMSMVLRAIEIEADCILGAKAVDGVYDSDPAKNPNAKKFDELSISKIVDERLGVIDLAASVLAMENNMPMLLFGLNEPNSIERAVAGENIGTLVHN